MLKKQADQGYVSPEEKMIAPLVLEDDNNTLFFTRRDPYGHVFMTLQTGTLPEKYQGAYTDIKYAQQDAEKYIAERKCMKEVINEEKKKEWQGKRATQSKTNLLKDTSLKPQD